MRKFVRTVGLVIIFSLMFIPYPPAVVTIMVAVVILLVSGGIGLITAERTKSFPTFESVMVGVILYAVGLWIDMALVLDNPVCSSLIRIMLGGWLGGFFIVKFVRFIRDPDPAATFLVFRLIRRMKKK